MINGCQREKFWPTHLKGSESDCCLHNRYILVEKHLIEGFREYVYVYSNHFNSLCVLISPNFRTDMTYTKFLFIDQQFKYVKVTPKYLISKFCRLGFFLKQANKNSSCTTIYKTV